VIYDVCYITNSISDMSEADYDAMQALVDKGECPICHRTFGRREKRQCAVAHLRNSKEPTHVMWRARWWTKMFPHGKYANHPRDDDLLPQAIRDAVLSTFGAEVKKRHEFSRLMVGIVVRRQYQPPVAILIHIPRARVPAPRTL
jgi:hypothetical protein